MKKLAVVFMGAARARRLWERSLPHKLCPELSAAGSSGAVCPMALWARSRSVSSDVRNTSAKAASCIVQVRKRSRSTNTIVGR